jgi:hypothetical protein
MKGAVHLFNQITSHLYFLYNKLGKFLFVPVRQEIPDKTHLKKQLPSY